jgi:hypothetical protein
VLTHNDAVINDDIQISVFVRQGQVPLVPLGFGIQDAVFDPLDVALRSFISRRLKETIELGVNNILVSPSEIIFTEDDKTVRAVVPYLNEKIGQVQSALLAIPTAKIDTGIL